MKNTVKNIIKNTNTLTELKALVNEFNANVQDKQKNVLSPADLVTIKDKVNEVSKANHSSEFITMLESDRQGAFVWLFNNATFEKANITEESNGQIKFEIVKSVNGIADIEKAYRLKKSVKVNKNGKAVPNNEVTIFEFTRFYGLLEKFMQNLLVNQVSENTGYTTDLSRIVLGDKTFTESESKAFDNVSISALDKQMRVLTAFFGNLEIKTRKKDIPVLRGEILKLKFDVEVLSMSATEQKTSRFLNKVIYPYFLHIYHKHTLTITTQTGETVNLAENTSTSENKAKRQSKSKAQAEPVKA